MIFRYNYILAGLLRNDSNKNESRYLFSPQASPQPMILSGLVNPQDKVIFFFTHVVELSSQVVVVFTVS